MEGGLGSCDIQFKVLPDASGVAGFVSTGFFQWSMLIVFRAARQHLSSKGPRAANVLSGQSKLLALSTMQGMAIEPHSRKPYVPSY